MEDQTEYKDTKDNIKNDITIPAAIIIAGLLISGAVIYTNVNTQTTTTNTTQQGVVQKTGSTDDVRPVDSNDHILGNPDAPVVIVEYSDFECPFCKRFQGTMNQIMKEYGESGKVAWVYRQFPLDQLHPKNGRKVAATSECVSELAGNKVFWQFANRFFELTPSNDNTDLTTVLPKIYKDIGIDQKKVEKCVSSGKYDVHIQDDIDNAIKTGGRGTPWSIVISKSGKTFPLSGSQPYTTVKQLIEIALKEK
ncbi:MAG TPA: DsbA family protein [Candidatus Kaiserbacteria bacterium]|nr:DsbA family protein [Candidatus Kaiserbacteria bacterium]